MDPRSEYQVIAATAVVNLKATNSYRMYLGAYVGHLATIRTTVTTAAAVNQNRHCPNYNAL